jgi:hypothetical protein
MYLLLTCRSPTFSLELMPRSWVGSSPPRIEAGFAYTSHRSLSKSRNDHGAATRCIAYLSFTFHIRSIQRQPRSQPGSLQRSDHPRLSCDETSAEDRHHSVWRRRHSFWKAEKDLPVRIVPSVIKSWDEAVMNGYFALLAPRALDHLSSQSARRNTVLLRPSRWREDHGRSQRWRNNQSD